MKPSVVLILAAGCGARTELGVIAPNDASTTDVVHDASFVDVVLPHDAAPLCAAGPTRITPTDLAASQIALDDTTIFFRVLDGVHSVPKAGGASTTIVTAPEGPFIVRASDIVWGKGDINSLSIMSTPKAGGASTTIVTELNIFQQFDLAPKGLFISGSTVTNNELLLFIPPSTTVPVAKVPLATFHVLADGDTLYMASEGGVWSMDANGTLLHVASGPLGNASLTFAVLVTLDATNVYFISVTDLHVAEIMSAPKTGGAASVFAEDSNQDFADLVLDSSHLYFTQPEAGLVVRMALDGSDRTVVATNPAGVFGVAVDATSIYWTATDGIYCAAK